jgi:ubiquinol-cytochrome c reductase iron-sulfur subunit
MSSEAASAPTDGDRRVALISTCVVGGAGTIAAAVPFLLSFQPSERAKAACAPVEADVGTIGPGEMKTFEWQGKPVWVLRRTPEMLASIKKTDDRVNDPKSERTAPGYLATPKYAKNEFRSAKPEFLVVVGICTHLGCSPKGPFGADTNPQLGSDPGFVCPCHGSTFDLAGRVFKNKPAPDNLPVPPYKFLSDTVLLIGDDAKA